MEMELVLVVEEMKTGMRRWDERMNAQGKNE